MHLKRRVFYLLVSSALGLMVFLLGVLAGLAQAGKIEYLSHNLDLSDWLSAVIILMLLLALRLSLTMPQPRQTERFPMKKQLLAFTAALWFLYGFEPAAWASSTAWPPIFQQDSLSGRDITLGATQVPSSSAGRDMTLQGTQITGSASAGRDLHGQGCGGTPTFHAGRDIQLSQCRSVLSATAGRNLELAGVEVRHDVASGRNLVVKNSKIGGNAQAGGNVLLEDAEIQGTLHVALPYLLVSRSKLGSIRVSQPLMVFPGNGIVIGNGNVVTSNGSSIVSSGGSSVMGINGQSVISVRENSTSYVNGYTVQGGLGQTTVITPDGSVYLNGAWVSGPGPKTYAAYKTQTPTAPTIIGPGWQDTGSSYPIPKTGLPPQPQQVVELKDNSSVSGPIVFEGGHGKVLVHQNATFSGQVEGGVVESLK